MHWVIIVLILKYLDTIYHGSRSYHYHVLDAHIQPKTSLLSMQSNSFNPSFFTGHGGESHSNDGSHTNWRPVPQEQMHQSSHNVCFIHLVLTNMLKHWQLQYACQLGYLPDEPTIQSYHSGGGTYKHTALSVGSRGSIDDSSSYSNHELLANLPYFSDAGVASQLPISPEYGYFNQSLGASSSQSLSATEGVNIPHCVPPTKATAKLQHSQKCLSKKCIASKPKRKIPVMQYFSDSVHRDEIEDTFEDFDDAHLQELLDKATELYNMRMGEMQFPVGQSIIPYYVHLKSFCIAMLLTDDIRSRAQECITQSRTTDIQKVMHVVV